ncbi:MAG: hypothetical protein CK427_15620 [Leptospira sp.]|nr:MAG: hypothetical protein CK427_15620 [Leptospira sp.]
MNIFSFYFQASKIIVLIFLLSNLFLFPIHAKKTYFFKQDAPYEIHLFGGNTLDQTNYYAMSPNSFWNLANVFNSNTRFYNSRIIMLGATRELDYKMRFLNFALEADLGKHYGVMNHWEGDLLFVAKIKNIGDLPFHFSMGEGISYASKTPTLENASIGYDLLRRRTNYTFEIETRPLLNYLMMEVEFGSYESSYPRVFVRIHHRSGVFGLYCDFPPGCGSNYLTYGIRLPLTFIDK